MQAGVAFALSLLALVDVRVAQSADDEVRVWKTGTRGFEWFFANVKKPNGPCDGEHVVATWYDSGTHTASGEVFKAEGLTAAHRTLPFGSKVTIINPHTNKSVTVVINDRGPFTKGVTLDLARGAARAIGMTQTQWVCMGMVPNQSAAR
jgi:rare lipoprotein A